MNATATQPVVSLRHVGKSFPRDGGGLLQVLGDVNLDVMPHEIVCVVGPSGCGKSTMLAGIGGFVPFSEGECLIEGRPAGAPDRHRGVVFQDYPILSFLTAVDNVAAGLHFERFSLLENLIPLTRRRRSRAARQEAEEYLAHVGLSGHGHKYPSQLSGGQRQRVAIAQAVAMKPKVLLMDEPFSGLDPDTREKLQLLVLRIHRELNNTIFFVTHDLEEAVFLGDRVVVLSQFSPERRPEDGASIVYTQSVSEFTNPEAKESAEFGQLVQLLRSKFHLQS